MGRLLVTSTQELVSLSMKTDSPTFPRGVILMYRMFDRAFW
jgi:hypothetical protein